MDLFESFSGDPENSGANSGGMSGGISRRSVMKAGAAAAWSVPLVQVVAAAPAVAVSQAPVLSFTNFSANYGQAAGPSAADPTHLFVTATVKNTGGLTTGLQVTLTIPANLYDTAPSVAASAGWSPSPASGSLAAGWTIVLTVTSQVGPGASSPTLSATLTLSDSVAAKKFDGVAFDLKADATATNQGTQAASTFAHVDPAPTANATLTINRFAAAYAKSGKSFTVGVQQGSPGGRTTVKASGATSSVGPVDVTVKIPKTTAAPFNTRPTGKGNATWTLTGSSDTSTHWGYVFRSAAKIAPNAESDGFDATFTYANSTATPSVTVTCDASGDRANAAVQVSATTP